jgi:hypothetical protein
LKGKEKENFVKQEPIRLWWFEPQLSQCLGASKSPCTSLISNPVDDGDAGCRALLENPPVALPLNLNKDMKPLRCSSFVDAFMSSHTNKDINFGTFTTQWNNLAYAATRSDFR